MADGVILHGDNLELLAGFADGSFQVAYADPPFTTGRRRERQTLVTRADADGDRVGFGGRRVVRIASGHDGKQESGVLHGARHWAGGVLAVADRHDVRAADQADGRLEPDDAVDR